DRAPPAPIIPRVGERGKPGAGKTARLFPYLYWVSLVFRSRPSPSRASAAPCDPAFATACASASAPALILTALLAGLALGRFLLKALLHLLEELVMEPELVGDARAVLGVEAVPIDAGEGLAREANAGEDHVLEGMAVDVFQLVGAGNQDHVGHPCAGALNLPEHAQRVPLQSLHLYRPLGHLNAERPSVGGLYRVGKLSLRTVGRYLETAKLPFLRRFHRHTDLARQRLLFRCRAPAAALEDERA